MTKVIGDSLRIESFQRTSEYASDICQYEESIGPITEANNEMVASIETTSIKNTKIKQNWRVVE